MKNKNNTVRYSLLQYGQMLSSENIFELNSRNDDKSFDAFT